MNAASSPPSRAAFPAARVTPNPQHAFGGIWRLTARRFFTVSHWLLLAGMLALLVLFSIPAAHNPESAAEGFLPWAAHFYVCFLLPILTFISAGGVMRDDLKSDSVDYIFTRPIARPLFVLFRYVSHVACTQINFLFALGAIIGIGLYHEVPRLWDAVPLLLLAQFLGIIAFSGFGFLCGLITSRYVIVGLFYGTVIEIGIGNVPTQINQLSMLRHLLGIMRPFLGESVLGFKAQIEDTLGLPATITALLGFAVVTLAATAAAFSFKELAGASSREHG